MPFTPKPSKDCISVDKPVLTLFHSSSVKAVLSFALICWFAGLKERYRA